MNSRFAVAVHILTLIAQAEGEPVTSEYIAGSVNTNPSLVRRILSLLTRAGLTTAQMGTGGGALLARAAERITLRDVYRAVDDGELFALHRERPNPACPVGRNIQALLETRFDAATRALEAELDRTTIADALADVARCEGEAAGARRAS
ncbi:MAG TPA: Rrf2 family transcriptional regulator [Longimicrobiaceae bacterium]|nr:Rrf2 family transcriptional regulator [Longimicrobiaceae bacterium]